MLRLDYTLPNLAKICLHNSTDSNFYPFTEGEKDLLEKIREDMVGGPSIVFTRKAVVDKTFIRKLTNLCESFVGIDASQLYPLSMCQPMPTGLYTRWNYDSESQKFMPRKNDIGDLMKEYAEKEGIMSQPIRMLISSFHQKNGTIITPLLLYYLNLGLECKKFMNSFNILPRSVSIALYSLPSMLEDKEMKIQTQA